MWQKGRTFLVAIWLCAIYTKIIKGEESLPSLRDSSDLRGILPSSSLR